MIKIIVCKDDYIRSKAMDVDNDYSHFGFTKSQISDYTDNFIID